MTTQPPEPQAPIPTTIVTGFLGAGKTSLVNRLITARSGAERIGVVVNEAGEIGLDGELLGDASDDVVEIADGCVCCTSQGELLDSVTRLYRAAGRLDRIIVETSGLADPGPVVDALASIAHVLRLDTMITVVDAVHALDQLDRDRSPEAHQQVQLATHVLVSKADLADADLVSDVRARVGALNPEAHVVVGPSETRHDDLLLDRFSLAAADDDDAHGHDHGHDHEHLDVEIFSVELPGELDPGRFDGWLGGLIMLKSPDLFRIKGILAMAGEPRRQILHGVQSYVDSTPGRDWEPGEPRTSRLLIIGRELENARWRDELARCVVG
ncbi:MAG TPA: GTP-binding protein [Solirubrobacteraceae bacterium]|nr:GTP-binding protein [Solirubrobacteraceae bacterium]